MNTATYSKIELRLMAHLLRRAGFGATQDQLEEYCALGYEATVEELLSPKYGQPEDQDLIDRYFIASVEARSCQHGDPQWSWRLLTSNQQLEEKIALFWHGLLAVGGSKLDHGHVMLKEIDLFRRIGLSKVKDILISISRDPGMMYWLDNQNSHKEAPNENYGRELLELFSMGINEEGEGTYTEDDVKAAARAFTGWASKPTPPPFFLGPFPMEFRFDPDDHDDGEKTFLGETGNFNGEDVIDIIVRNRATARFFAKRIYLFFVSDKPDDKEIERLADIFEATDGSIRAMLKEVFLSEHFKSIAVRFRKVKSPAELIYGTVRLTNRCTIPAMDEVSLVNYSTIMGQHLLNPPSVEGWHEGEEWVDSGSLIERINFAAEELSRRDAPGVRRIIERVQSLCNELQPATFVEACLEAMGMLDLSKHPKQVLIDHVASSGPVVTGNQDFEDRTIEMLRLIVSTPDYQYC